MRKLILALGLCFPFLVSGQNVDSEALKRVDSLIQKSSELTNTNEFEKALNIIVIAEELAINKLGEKSLLLGNVYASKGRIYLIKNEPAEAEKWLVKAKLIYEKGNKKLSTDYASILYNLGYVYEDLIKYDAAELVLLESKNIREQLLGKHHPVYAESLNILGTLYYYMMNYEKAEQYYLQANAVDLETSGKMSENYASSLHNIGLLHHTMGDLEKAEAFFMESITIHRETVGKENASYALYLNNFGSLCKELGDYQKAGQLYSEALAIREKILGKDHPRSAWVLNNLGNLYHYIGENEKAEQFLIPAIEIFKKTNNGPNETYANALINLGGVYREMRNYEKATQILLKAQKAMEEAVGKDHPDYSVSLMNLGALYLDMGKFKESLELFLAAKNLRENKLGKENLFYEESLDKLAILHWKNGSYKEAGNYIKESSEIEQKLLIRLTRFSSETGLAGFMYNFKGRLNQIFSFNQTHPILNSSCYDNILFHKGFLLNAVSKNMELALKDSATTEEYYQLKALQRRLASEYSTPLSERQNVSALEEKANAIEKEIARKIFGFGNAFRQVNWREVQQGLKPDELAIEFVNYQFVNPNPTDSIMYAAIILRPGMSQPAFIPLFEKKQLDSLLLKPAKTKVEYINQLYSTHTGSKSLYDLIWKPIEGTLKGVKRIYFSSSGLLHRLSLASIPVPNVTQGAEKTERLADHYQLIALGSTRQLVLNSALVSTKAPIEAQLYGGILYELDSTAITGTNRNTLASSRGYSVETLDSTLRGGKWNYLKWTEVEVNGLEPILNDAGLKSKIFKGNTATEESFKQIGNNQPSPRVIHLATHGFFFPDPKLKKDYSISEEKAPVFKISDHPMIRSGIILAGGNYAWQHGKPVGPNQEDGILTAYEISQMNLRNTELVVLSACETGLGDIQGNEGVYGLQRAFKIAGAKYLIMSLWQVPDFQTQELMTTFYSKWLDDKMNIPDAFRAAQNAMKNKYKEPFYWAGFVLIE